MPGLSHNRRIFWRVDSPLPITITGNPNHGRLQNHLRARPRPARIVTTDRNRTVTSIPYGTTGMIGESIANMKNVLKRVHDETGWRVWYLSYPISPLHWLAPNEDLEDCSAMHRAGGVVTESPPSEKLTAYARANDWPEIKNRLQSSIDEP
jgi:hypothetical protein